MRRSLAILIATALIHVVARNASAQVSTGARLAWVRSRGADSCVDGATFERDVLRRLDRTALGLGAGRSVEVVVVHEGLYWTARIFLRASAGSLIGSREISTDATPCQPITSAAAFAVAMAIDPEATLRTMAAEVSPSPAPASSSPPPTASTAPRAAASALPPAAASPQPNTSAPLVRRGHRPVSTLALQVGISSGPTPGTSLGVALAGGVRFAQYVFVPVELAWQPETRSSDGRFAFGLTRLTTGVCAAWSPVGVLSLFGCALATAGAVHTVVYQSIPVEPGERVWGAVGPAARLQLRIAPHVHIEGGVDVLFDVTRYDFIVQGESSPAFSQAWTTVFAHLGLGTYFP